MVQCNAIPLCGDAVEAQNARTATGLCHDNRIDRTQPGLPRGGWGNARPNQCAAVDRRYAWADRNVARAPEAGSADMSRLGLPDSDLLGAGICPALQRRLHP